MRDPIQRQISRPPPGQVPVQVWMEQDLRDRGRERATARGLRNLSELIRELLREEVERAGQ